MFPHPTSQMGLILSFSSNFVKKKIEYSVSCFIIIIIFLNKVLFFIFVALFFDYRSSSAVLSKTAFTRSCFLTSKRILGHLSGFRGAGMLFPCSAGYDELNSIKI
jgi:hypothetical protein